MTSRGIALGVGLLALGPGCTRKGAAPGPPAVVVAAAADLAFALPEIGRAFEKATGRPVVFSFGSTGLLERQIAEGAPFDAFAAANVAYADGAVASGACDGASKAVYATGRLALFVPEGAKLGPGSLGDLADPRVKTVAIANPEHAPYGKAAKQALERAGLWGAVGPKVVYGENVQQALQFAQSGNADAAIVALSLAKVTPGRVVELPAGSYDAFEQAVVACRNGKAGLDAGRRFAAFLRSPEAQATLERAGFGRP